MVCVFFYCRNTHTFDNFWRICVRQSERDVKRGGTMRVLLGEDVVYIDGVVSHKVDASSPSSRVRRRHVNTHNDGGRRADGRTDGTDGQLATTRCRSHVTSAHSPRMRVNHRQMYRESAERERERDCVRCSVSPRNRVHVQLHVISQKHLMIIRQ